MNRGNGFDAAVLQLGDDQVDIAFRGTNENLGGSMKSIRKQYSVQRALYTMLLLLGLIPVGGCSGVAERSWTEDVALDDGRVIVIDRYVKLKQSNALGGGAYSSTDLESKLTFRDEMSALPAWSVPLVPIVLFHDQPAGEWVIVATTGNCDTWYEHGKPLPPYWEYRLRNGKWLESKLSKASIGRKSNLFFDYESKVPAKRLTQEIKHHVIATNDFAKDYLGVNADIKMNCNY
jgi:hypothetical protein